jgi:hypothetical protein
MGATKVSISMDSAKLREVKKIARSQRRTLSAFLSDRVDDYLRHLHARRLFEELMEGQAPISEAERAQLERLWPRGG